MRWKLLPVVLLVLAGLAPRAHAGDAEDEPEPLFDPAPLVASFKEVLTAPTRIEFLEMVRAIRKGSRMGAGDGWFHAGQSRYGWKWLADRHGIKQNGKIPRAAFKGPPELFDRLDRDHDGVLTRGDFDWSDRAMQGLMSGPAGYLFYLFDTNSNGRISKEEWDAFFTRAAKGKDYLTREDLREAILPPEATAKDTKVAKKPSGPTPGVLLKGLVEGELGSPYEGPRIGAAAPDFALKTLDRKQTIRLSDFRGKRPVVLIFGSFT
jgi:hypothetical protein